MSIPKRLKQSRKLLKLTQEEIAVEIKLKQKDVSRFENGKVKFIPNHYLVFLFEKGINLNWLFTGEGASWIKDIAPANDESDVTLVGQTSQDLQQENLQLKEENLVVKTENKVFKQQIKELKSERKTLMEVFKTLGKGNLFK